MFDHSDAIFGDPGLLHFVLDQDVAPVRPQGDACHFGHSGCGATDDGLALVGQIDLHLGEVRPAESQNHVINISGRNIPMNSNKNCHHSIISTFFLVLAFVALALPTAQTEQLPTYDILSLSTIPHHRMPIDIASAFSKDSDVTAVMISCDNLLFLQMAINSFFHYNTYVLSKFIVVETCSSKIELQIWDLLPLGAQQYPQHFSIILNQQKTLKPSALDDIIAQITTQYIYLLTPDWMQTASYGLIQRMTDALQDAKQKGLKVSQVLPQNQQSLGSLHLTSRLTRYYHKNVPQSPQFTLLPCLIDLQSIYVGLLKGSVKNSVELECNYNGYQCLLRSLAVFFARNEFSPAYIELSGQSVFQKTEASYQPLQLDQLLTKYQPPEEETRQIFFTPITTNEHQLLSRSIKQLYLIMAACFLLTIVCVTKAVCLVMTERQEEAQGMLKVSQEPAED